MEIPNKRWIELLAIAGVMVFVMVASYVAKPIDNQNSYANAWDMFWDIPEVYPNHLPDTLVVNENYQQEHLGRYYFWWNTPEANMPVPQVVKAFEEGKFKPWKRNPLRQQANGDEYWIYLNVKNPYPVDLNMFWDFQMYGTNAVLYRLYDDGSYARIDSVSAHEHVTQRDVKNIVPMVAFTLPKDSTSRYLVKLNKTVCWNLSVSFNLYRADGKTAYQFPLLQVQAIVMGLYPFAIVLFLSLYVMFKDRLYLYQCLYIFITGYWALYAYGLFAIMLPKGFFVVLSYMPQLLPATAATSLLAIIFWRFTQIETIRPRLAQYLKWAIKLNFFSLGIHLLLYALGILLPHDAFWAIGSLVRWIPIMALALLIPLLMVCSVSVYWITEQLPTRIYTGIMLFILLLWGTHLTNMGGLTNRNFIYPNNLLNALAIEITVFTILMLFRFYQERKERVALLEQQLLLKQELTTSIIEAQESERKRIAQELHDGLGGLLAALRLMINKRKNSLPETENNDTKQLLEEVQYNLDKVIKDVRNISHNLMPAEFDAKEFTEILKEHLINLNEHGNVEIDYYFDPKVNHLAKNLQINLYRIASELIKNIHTHAQATTATVQIVVHPDSVILQVEDNGKGFDHTVVSKGLGLSSIRSRVAVANGKLSIDSGKLGTNIIVDIPTSYDQA